MRFFKILSFNQFPNFLRHKHQSGQSLLEYLILTSLIAIGCLGVVRVISKNMGARLSSVAEALNGETKKYQGEKVQRSHYSKKSLENFMDDAGQ